MYASVVLIAHSAAYSACRDCAQGGFGGPAENRFTAYDALCRGDFCREPGAPQAFVNVSNLTLFVRVTDLAFGGGFKAERSFNMDDTRIGPFGAGWTFSLGDALILDTTGSITLRRGSGRTDRFAFTSTTGTIAAVTPTNDVLARNSDGAYTLRETSSGTLRDFGVDGRLLAIRVPASPSITLGYDSGGQLSAAHYRGRTIQFAFSNGRIVSMSDSAGRSLSFSYRSDGRLLRETAADGQNTVYDYDSAGNLVSITQGDRVTSIGYSGDPGYNYVSSVTAPDGGVRQYDMPLSPSQIRVRDANNSATFYVSSANGLLQSVTDAIGSQFSYAYDAAGRRTKLVNPSGESVSFTYDSSGNLTNITDNIGNRWLATYSTAGLRTVTDPNGNVTSFQYDSAANLTTVQSPGAATIATRSAIGQIATLTDPLGNKTTYQYDGDGLISTYVDALNGKWTYKYDGAARAISRTDPGGAVLEGAYGPGTRLRTITAGASSAAVESSGIRRDGLGRITTYTDDAGNRIAYAYDGAGQLNAMTLPGGNTVSYQYDSARRLTRVSDWLGNFVLYRYDVSGFPVSASVSGGPVTIYQYDAAHRLRAVVSTGPDGKPLAAYKYTLDANGNRSSVNALEPAAGAGAPDANTFNYDAASRLAGSGDGRSYRYDARGNLVGIDGARPATLNYDAFGRLQSVDAGGLTSYTYDSAGLRVSRSVNGAVRRFVYDLSGSQPRAVTETDAANTPTAWYVYGLGLLWKIDADGTPYFYHFDGDGNTVAISNPAKGLVNSYRYDFAGRLISSAESIDNAFRAHGDAGWMDDGNGLLYTGRSFLYPELRTVLPAVADPSPPVPALVPRFAGAGSCLVEGVANCSIALGRGDR